MYMSSLGIWYFWVPPPPFPVGSEGGAAVQNRALCLNGGWTRISTFSHFSVNMYTCNFHEQSSSWRSTLTKCFLLQAFDVPLWRHHGGKHGSVVSASALQLSPVTERTHFFIFSGKHLTDPLCSEVPWSPALTPHGATECGSRQGEACWCVDYSWKLKPGAEQMKRYLKRKENDEELHEKKHLFEADTQILKPFGKFVLSGSDEKGSL